jgi:hypothetical protein
VFGSEDEMMNVNFAAVVNIVLAGITLSIVMAIVGMVLWYIRVRPSFETTNADLKKKAELEEMVRINLELERKKEDAQRVSDILHSKQNISDCDLLRKGCQPLLLEQLNGLGSQINDLREGQKILFEKLDGWMVRNGK